MNCSFCDKSQNHVRKLIAGPNANICDECVDVCLNVLADQDEPTPPVLSDPERIGYMTDVSAHLRTACALCSTHFPLHQALALQGRGFLCPACVAEVHAALEVGEA